jgi:hypothetical protein
MREYRFLPDKTDGNRSMIATLCEGIEGWWHRRTIPAFCLSAMLHAGQLGRDSTAMVFIVRPTLDYQSSLETRTLQKDSFIVTQNHHILNEHIRVHLLST